MSDPPRYRILQSLGRGGMGEVFLADDTQLGRKVAIKFLTQEFEADATARERLLREARSAASLDRVQPGARDKARALLGEAIEQFERIGRPRYLESARAMLGALT